MPNHSVPEINAAQTWVQVLAAAYELQPEEVVQDAIFAANWCGAQEELYAFIRDRHTWDPSMPEYYVPALQAHLEPRRA
jgi:hypothetical protein